MYPHRIRLRGPWECEPLNGPAPRRVAMPADWAAAGLGDFHGLARFTRKFGYPGRIDAGEHVWLTCAGCTGARELRLNGQLLAPEPNATFAFDVTSILGPRNHLDVLIDGACDSAGLWGEVALEIRRDAYLADVNAARANDGVVVTGLAVGISPAPLELYTLLDNRHADYRTIQPTPTGTPFRIELPEPAAEAPRCARVDLIHVSSIWYTVEMAIPMRPAP